MAPPVFADLGKSANDILSKGYHFSQVKLDVKTKTAEGIELNSGGTSNLDSGKVSGNLETKYKLKDLGMTFTEKWTTDNQLNTKIDVEDQLLKGLKLTLDTSFSPQTGAKSGKVKAELKQDAVTVNSDVDLNLGGPVVNASAVIGHNGWLVGYSLAFDSAKSKLIKNHFGLGYSVGDFTLHTNVQDGQVFNGSVYHKVSGAIETGVTLGWTASSNATTLGLGCKYVLDSDASIRAKVNNASQIGLGYQQKLRPGVTLTLSSLIDGKNFNQGGHKLGLALELES